MAFEESGGGLHVANRNIEICKDLKIPNSAWVLPQAKQTHCHKAFYIGMKSINSLSLCSLTMTPSILSIILQINSAKVTVKMTKILYHNQFTYWLLVYTKISFHLFEGAFIFTLTVIQIQLTGV